MGRKQNPFVIIFLFTLLTVRANASDSPQPDGVARFVPPFVSGVGPARTLRVISRRLRGIDPTRSETLSAQAVWNDSDARSRFVTKKIEEYMRSPRFDHKLRHWTLSTWGIHSRSAEIQEWQDSIFLFQASRDQLAAYGYSARPETERSRLLPGTNSQTAIINHVLRNDLPWETLFTLDLDFEAVDAIKPHPDLSGLFTTSAFAERYAAPVSNRGFRGAAAFYDIMFCDRMELGSAGADLEQESLFRATQTRKATVGTVASSEVARHASDPNCQSCHVKLDPMAPSFLGGSRESILDSSIGLMAPVNNQTLRGHGLKDLVRKAVATEAFAECQIRRFWNEFVSSTPPTRARLGQLRTLYQSSVVARRPKNFVRTLLLLPEAYPTSRRGQSTAHIPAQVSTVLQRCQTCHEATSSRAKETLSSVLQFQPNAIATTLDRTTRSLSAPGAMPPSRKGYPGPEIAVLVGWLRKASVTRYTK